MSLHHFLLAVCCTAVSATTHAQSLLSKVPADAALVIRYSGENFATNVPVKKLDSYPFIRNNLYQLLHIDTLVSLDETGINLQQDAFQYILTGDTGTCFVTLLMLRDTAQFKSLLQQQMQAELRPVYRNGYASATISSGSYVAWNHQWAVITMSSYLLRKKYYDYPVVSADTAAEPVLITVAPPAAAEKVEIVTEKPAPRKTTPVKPGAGRKKTGVSAQKKPAKKMPAKKPAPKKETIPDEIVEDHLSYEDSLYNARRDAWFAEQQRHADAVQQKMADSISELAFNSTVKSIINEISYPKLIDPAAHVTVWLNYDNLLSQYAGLLFKGMGKSMYNGWQPRNTGQNTHDGFRTGLSIFFEKNRMRMEQKMYSPNPQLSQLGKEMYSSRQSGALAGYINPGCVAYLSSSLNTEALANYWYHLMRQYLSSNPFTGEYADIVDVYMDLMEIIIDEKSIGELLPGNAVMVLHSLQPRMISYTDYEYDDNFKATEVIKTRQEMAPDFSIVLETKKEAFMQKLARLPLKYADKGKFSYKDQGGYYELSLDSTRNPMKALYFMVKNGRAVITTSLETVNHTLNNTGYPLDEITRQSVFGNNFSLRINTKKIIEQLRPELGDGLNQKITRYFEENMGDLSMEGSYRDGLIQGTTYMNINGKHTNSLEFFFNMIEDLNTILEKDKTERAQKVD